MQRSVYDSFAWFYDRHWAGLFADSALFALETLVLPHVPLHARLLDLCCGTGQVAAELAARGYRLTGLDLSNSMLALARRRSRDVGWVCADARRFALEPDFHAAYSIFDSMNHLLTPEGLTYALRNVHRCLRSEGWFVFDCNTEEGFRQRWVRDYRVETRDGECHLQGAYDPDQRLGRYRFTLRGKGADAWRCADFELVERCHTEVEVRAALSAAGFGEVDLHHAVDDLGLEDEPGRVFYAARKGCG